MDQTNFNYYEADNVYGALFFQFPKVLMYGEQYKNLSDTAKLAYMVLKDRLEYSLRNHWVDEEGHVYFIFTNKELENLFNCHNQKVIKIKNELTSAHLLKQKAMHFNPKTKKMNRIVYTFPSLMSKPPMSIYVVTMTKKHHNPLVRAKM